MNSQSSDSVSKVSPWPVVIALVHTLILACYALPEEVIPERLRFWSASYTRPMFHQQWNLFAPDVPPCGCTIVIDMDGKEVDLMNGKGLLERRLVKWGCRSMSNYRYAGRTEDFRPWPGFDRYMRELLDTDSLPRTHVRRECVNGNGPRKVYYDEATFK